uniref:G_PROTEIN_RECEP_F1_2 domain-containing protein n=1 Tax=Angiostrongylus cantonensis TaxID=6313 RepID=A0A158P6X0_ANGCA
MENCTSIQDVMFETIDITAVRVVFSLLYTLVWVAAIVGNILVLYVISFKQVAVEEKFGYWTSGLIDEVMEVIFDISAAILRSMNSLEVRALAPSIHSSKYSYHSYLQVSFSVRTVFIGCLAVSDLLMSLTSLPWTAVTIFTREWIFPRPICKLIAVFQGGSIFVSSFTLTVIALDRCLLILKPNKEIIGYNRAVAMVISIWVLGYILALPVGIFSRAVNYDDLCGVFCEEIWFVSCFSTTIIIIASSLHIEVHPQISLI